MKICYTVYCWCFRSVLVSRIIASLGLGLDSCWSRSRTMGLEKHPVLVSVLVSKKLSGLGLGLGLEACGLDYNTGRCLLQFCATNELCIMNTFFQDKRIHKYTWYKDSLGQPSPIDFCIASADLFSTVSDVRVKRGAELSTDHHLVVCTLKALKP